MKTLVVYYSKNGSNKFLAKKIAEALNCEITRIKPKFDVHFFMIFGLNFGIRKLEIDPTQYDRIILCGPIWMGKFIVPLKEFAQKYKDHIKELFFVTCCASSFEAKDEKFGHAHVFNKAKAIFNEKCIHCEAFPITLVVPDDKKEDSNTVMNTRLTNDNFKGEILQRFNEFINRIST